MFRYPARRVTVNDDKCPICLISNTNFKYKLFVILPCKHEFHDRCLDDWMKVNRTCPMCRTKLKPQMNNRERALSPITSHNVMFNWSKNFNSCKQILSLNKIFASKCTCFFGVNIPVAHATKLSKIDTTNAQQVGVKLLELRSILSLAWTAWKQRNWKTLSLKIFKKDFNENKTEKLAKILQLRLRNIFNHESREKGFNWTRQSK